MKGITQYQKLKLLPANFQIFTINWRKLKNMKFFNINRPYVFMLSCHKKMNKSPIKKRCKVRRMRPRESYLARQQADFVLLMIFWSY